MATLRSSQSTSHNRRTAGGFAWRVVSFPALSVIVFEGAGAVDGLKRSAALLEQTWGENVSFNLGLGVLGIALTAPVIVVLAIAQAAGALPLSFLGCDPAAGLRPPRHGAVLRLSAVLKAALYRWANDRPLDRNFGDVPLREAFAAR